MPKIHIDIKGDIDVEDAVRRVAHVIAEGKICGDGKYYCYMTCWNDGINVSVNLYRKSDCFVVWKSGYKNEENERNT